MKVYLGYITVKMSTVARETGSPSVEPQEFPKLVEIRGMCEIKEILLRREVRVLREGDETREMRPLTRLREIGVVAATDMKDFIADLFQYMNKNLAAIAADALFDSARADAEYARDSDMMTALAVRMFEHPEMGSAGVEWLANKFPDTNFGGALIDINLSRGRDAARTLARLIGLDEENFKKVVDYAHNVGPA